MYMWQGDMENPVALEGIALIRFGSTWVNYVDLIESTQPSSKRIMYVFLYIQYNAPFLLLLDQVTDLDFSPFDDYLLATCSADEMVMCVLLSFFFLFMNWNHTHARTHTASPQTGTMKTEIKPETNSKEIKTLSNTVTDIQYLAFNF